jgi:chromosomal replication initiator protein
MDRIRLFNSPWAESESGERDDRLSGLQVWQTVCDTLKMRLGEAEYSRWIDGLRLVAEYDGTIIIAARDALTLDRVSANYQRLIERLWAGLDAAGRPLQVVCWRQAPEDLRAIAGDPWAAPVPAVAEEPLPPPAGSRHGAPEMSFDTLVTGPSNEIAASLARRIAAGQPVGTPTVLIYGPQGTGKTHLLHALRKAALAADPSRCIVYLTAEEFMSAYHDGVRVRDTSSLKKRLRAASLLLIDDLHRIAGKPGTETELQQNIREVAAAGGETVLVGDSAPGEAAGFGPRMRAELRGATAVEITLPDTGMRREILTRLARHIEASHPEFRLSDDMIARLNLGIKGPGRELTGAVWSLYTEANFGETAPTPELVERVIRRHAGTRREPSIDLVKRATQKVFAIDKAALEGPSKMRSNVYPRQIAMYLCRTRTGKSLPQIGRAFGNRDHTTVLYACRRIEAKIGGDSELVADIQRVETMLADIISNGPN